MFGAYLLAVLALGAVFFFSQKKLTKQVDARLDKVQERMENIEFASGGTDDFKNVKINEIKKRLDALEQNMADFLERVEVRAGETAIALEKVTEASQAALLSAQAAQSKVDAPSKIEQRLLALEEKLANYTLTPPNARSGNPSTTSATSAPSPKPRFMPDSAQEMADTLDLLLGCLNTLHDNTRMVALQKRIETVSPLLEKGKVNGELDPDDVGQLGRLLQLCYTSAHNEGLAADYKRLAEGASLLGIGIEDSMAGRMAFSEFYAENVPVEIYFTEERFRTDVFPEFRSAKAEIENQLTNPSAVPGTVLYCLQPTVTLLQEGGKKLLQKGIYVVK
jgi:tetrahydromethanopterin S-methyltransferase subunit G